MDKNEITIDNKSYIPRCGVVSYPRSGNTFFRNCFETVTGKITGEDMGDENEITEIAEKFKLDIEAIHIHFEQFDYLTKKDYCLVKTHFPWWVLKIENLY